MTVMAPATSSICVAWSRIKAASPSASAGSADMMMPTTARMSTTSVVSRSVARPVAHERANSMR